MSTSDPIPPDPHLHVVVSRRVPVGPDEAYAAVTDITAMPRRSPETVKTSWKGEPGAKVGAQFRGTNRIGLLSWSTVATVDLAEPGRQFAFTISPPSRSTWTYTFEDDGAGGCVITESMTKADQQPWPIRMMQRLVGVDDRAEHLRQGMQTTLDRLADELASARS